VFMPDINCRDTASPDLMTSYLHEYVDEVILVDMLPVTVLPILLTELGIKTIVTQGKIGGMVQTKKHAIVRHCLSVLILW